MASEIQIENQSAIAWQPVAGSLQAMNLGCMPLGQMGTSVNWRNEHAFTAPDCKPWVELPWAASNTASVSKPSLQASLEATKPLEAPPARSVPPSDSDSEVMAASPSQELSMDEVAQQDAITKESAEQELAAKEVVFKEPVADETQAVTTRVEVESAPVPFPNISSDSSTTVEAISKPVPFPPDLPATGSETKTVSEPRMSLASSKQSDRSRVADSQPPRARVEASSLNLDETVSFLSSNPRAPRDATSSEDYLLQLERLVLELNMELGRSRGESKPSDPMEQMANRIIALNLENLALREKLQRSLNLS